MGAPIQLPGLPVAAVANDADTTLLRQGVTDFQCAIGLIRQINFGSLANIPVGPAQSDFMLISRANQNFRVAFSSVGFGIGTGMWFYNTSSQIAASMLAWRVIPNSGDALLACAGGGTYSPAQTQNGTWTPASFNLTIGQIPAHQHGMRVLFNQTSGNSQTNLLASVPGHSTPDGVQKTYHTGGTGSAIGSSNPDAYTSPFTDSFSATTDPVQPPSTWRPLANIGNLCTKIA